MDTLYEGAILAVIVVFLFLRDWRATIIAAVTLPLSIFPAFWVMQLFGFSLNIVTTHHRLLALHRRHSKMGYLSPMEFETQAGLT
jgi:multidrug efflux pump subunit AcrB